MTSDTALLATLLVTSAALSATEEVTFTALSVTLPVTSNPLFATSAAFSTTVFAAFQTLPTNPHCLGPEVALATIVFAAPVSGSGIPRIFAKNFTDLLISLSKAQSFFGGTGVVGIVATGAVAFVSSMWEG